MEYLRKETAEKGFRNVHVIEASACEEPNNSILVGVRRGWQKEAFTENCLGMTQAREREKVEGEQ